jgi:predicted amidohydrolase
MSTDAADLFCALFDEFGTPNLDPHEMHEWMTDEQVEDITSNTEGQVIESGTLDEEEVRASIERADDKNRRRFAYLQGIDNALLHAHPYTGTHDTAGLNLIARRYVRTGKFNTNSIPGALLPRFAFPADAHSPAEKLGDTMTAVVRVSSLAWDITEHTTIPNRSDFHRGHRERGVLFGCVPFLDRVDALEWKQSKIGKNPFFRGEVIPCDEIRQRIAVVLRRLDEQGAMVGVIPELCASEQVIQWWKDAIASNRAPRESNLRWILVGTGPTDSDLDPPANTAVLLDRLTGEVLSTQDKMHPFTLTAEQIDLWGLGEYVGASATTEHIAHGERLTIAECALGRLVMLICEDLARTLEAGPVMLAHGTSLALCPVFSDEIEEHHWEHNKAKEYADQIGTQIVVSNSRIIGCNQGEVAFGTALAHSPHDRAVGATTAADEVVLLRLSDEAAVNAISRTAGFEDYEESVAP